MMLGSTAERVARLAKCNVLIARKRVADTGAGAVVAVATDLTDKSDAALDFAAREAKRRSARLVAIHAVADANVLAYAELAAAFGATSIGPPPELDSEVHAAMSSLLAAKLAGSNVIGEVVLPHGEAARAVVGVVESMGAELVVIGRGRKSTLERIALGSVAEKIVRHAHCSVFVAREPEAG
jgi:nucleotide-binding universal stress UspA family protein